MQATLRLIGRNGLDGVTHRAVAAEAGVSLGAVTHHFGTRDALVDAALQFALAREVGRLRALALILQDKAFEVEAGSTRWSTSTLASSAPRPRRTSPVTRPSRAARQKRYRPVVAEWFDTWRQSAELVLKAAKSPHPRRHAELFVSALTGLVFRQLAAPKTGFRREAKAELLDLVGGLIAPR